MDILRIVGSIPFSTILAIAILVGFYRFGRIKKRRELAMAAALLIFLGVWSGWTQKTSNDEAEQLVETVFGLDPESTPLALRTHGAKGDPTRRIEAIYQLSPDVFDAVRKRQPSLAPPVSFRFQLGGWNPAIVDRFEVAADALAWQRLPRTSQGTDHYYVDRGTYSQKQTARESDMAGSYVCAFIPVPSDSGPYSVIPCSRAGRRPPKGITILSFLNEKDRTLHVLIK